MVVEQVNPGREQVEFLPTRLSGAEQVVHAGLPEPWSRRLLLLLAAGVVLVFWAMTAGSDDELAAVESDPLAETLREPAVSPQTSTSVLASIPARTTITFPPASLAETQRPSPGMIADIDRSLGFEPLGRRADLWLFVGGDGPLQRFNLQTGEFSLFGIRATPLASTGGELIIQGWDSGRTAWVGLDNPAEEADGWVNGEVALGADLETMWVRRVTTPALWQLSDLTNNHTLEQRELPVQAAPSSYGRDGATPRLGSSPDVLSTTDGIFHYESGTYRRAVAGRLVAAGADLALVERCGSTLSDCTMAWHAIDDGWRPVPFAIPDGPIAHGHVVGDGRWLKAWSGLAASLISLETGAVIAEASSLAALTVSPDGSLAARLLSDGTVEVLDTATGDVLLVLDELVQSGEGGLLLVPSEDR